MKSREEILEFFSVGIETETDRIDYETLCKNHDVIFDKGWLGQFGYYGVNGKEGFYDMSSHIPIGHKFKSLQEFKEFLEKGEESEPTDLIAEARRRGYKAGDEGKLKRFHSKAIKHLNDQVRIRKTEIEELHEKGVDLQEEYAEAVLSVDFDRISTTDNAKNYASSYVSGLMAYEDRIQEIDDSVEVLEEEIAKFEVILAKLGNA